MPRIRRGFRKSVVRSIRSARAGTAPPVRYWSQYSYVSCGHLSQRIEEQSCDAEGAQHRHRRWVPKGIHRACAEQHALRRCEIVIVRSRFSLRYSVEEPCIQGRLSLTHSPRVSGSVRDLASKRAGERSGTSRGIEAFGGDSEGGSIGAADESPSRRARQIVMPQSSDYPSQDQHP